MRDIDDLLPKVLIYVPNAPEPVALNFIRQAARQLCHNVRLWREYDSFTLDEPDCQGLTTIPDAEIVEIQAARLNGRTIKPVTVGWLDANHPGWDRQAEPASAQYVTQLGPRSVTVTPAESGTLDVRLVLMPSEDALTVADTLADRFASVIGKGAAAELLMMPGVDFANPQLGLQLANDFNARVGSLKVEFTKGEQGARLRTKGNWF